MEITCHVDPLCPWTRGTNQWLLRVAGSPVLHWQEDTGSASNDVWIFGPLFDCAQPGLRRRALARRPPPRRAPHVQELKRGRAGHPNRAST